MFNQKSTMTQGVTIYYCEEITDYLNHEAVWTDGEDKDFKQGAFWREERECIDADIAMTGRTAEMGIVEIYEPAYGSKVDSVQVNITGGTIFIEDKYRDADEILGYDDIFIEPDKFKFLKQLSEHSLVIYRNHVRGRDLVYEWVINNITENDYRKYRDKKIKDKTMACGYTYENRLGLYKNAAYIYTKGGTLKKEPRTKECRGYPVPKKLNLDYERMTRDRSVINNILYELTKG